MFKNRLIIVMCGIMLFLAGCVRKENDSTVSGSYVVVISKTEQSLMEGSAVISLTESHKGREQYIYITDNDNLNSLISYMKSINWDEHLSTKVYNEILRKGKIPCIGLKNMVEAVKGKEIDYINNGQSAYVIKNGGLGSNNPIVMPYYILKLVYSDSKIEPVYLCPFNGVVGYRQNLYVFDCNDQIFDLVRTLYKEVSEVINARLFYMVSDELGTEGLGSEYDSWYINMFYNTYVSNSSYRQYLLPQYISMAELSEVLKINGAFSGTLEDYVTDSFGCLTLNEIKETDLFRIKCIYDGGLNEFDYKEYIVTVKD